MERWHRGGPEASASEDLKESGTSTRFEGADRLALPKTRPSLSTQRGIRTDFHACRCSISCGVDTRRATVCRLFGDLQHDHALADDHVWHIDAAGATAVHTVNTGRRPPANPVRSGFDAGEQGRN
jgi:hypothetical protein